MSTQPPQDSIASHESLPSQAIPKVEYDPNLEGMAIVEIDAQFFGRLMASHGVSDEDIASVTLFASAETIVEGHEGGSKDDAMAQFGVSDPKTRIATLSIGSIEELMKYIIDNPDPAAPNGKEDLTELASIQATDTLAHEVGHMIDKILGVVTPADNRAYYTERLPEKRLGRLMRKLLRKSDNPAHHELADLHRQIEVGKLILKGSNISHEHYQGEPKEVFADSVAEEAMELTDPDNYPVKISFANLSGLQAK